MNAQETLHLLHRSRVDLPGFAMVAFQQQLEEILGSRSVTTCPEKHINHLTILVDSPPQALLFASDPYKNFVDVECIAEPLMPTFQPSGIFGAELVAPQTN